jgi:hypothetical protein
MGTSSARDIACRFRHSVLRAEERVQVDEPAVAVDREGERTAGVLNPDDSGAHPGQHEGVGPDHVVVLPVHPPFARNLRRRQQPPEHISGGRRPPERREIQLLRILQIRRLRRRPAIPRCVVREGLAGDIGDNLAAVAHSQASIRGDFADPHRVEIPLVEDLLDLRFTAPLGHQQHALLRLGEHDVVGRHARLALRHERHVDLDAGAAA